MFLYCPAGAVRRIVPVLLLDMPVIGWRFLRSGRKKSSNVWQREIFNRLQSDRVGMTAASNKINIVI